MQYKICQWLQLNKKKLWYMMCFLLLGLIDQRRGSARGDIQMLFTNGTGIVLALMVVPTLDLSKLKQKVYIRWTPICLVLIIAACVMGMKSQQYMAPWIAKVLNPAIWSYLFIYIFRERKELDIKGRIGKPFMLCAMLILLCMRENGVFLWYFMMLGGFFLIGIGKKDWSDFFQGMVNAFIVWFFVQQTIAFAFRPYDYVRYRGMYSGETQNGLFYMLVYCAFLVKWVWAREKRRHFLLRAFYFVMGAGCISFILFTGGRSPVLGAGIATLAILIWKDIVDRKSFYKFCGHGIALCLCVMLTFPMVYGCIRYLPTILHHPIWYDGEYVEGKSVCSIDPYNSYKYVTFEKVMEKNVGRILELLGVGKVHAAELGEPGSSDENRYETKGTFDTRIGMWSFYIEEIEFIRAQA